MNGIFVLFPFLFGAVFLFILIVGGMTFFNANRIFRVVMKSSEQQMNQSGNSGRTTVDVEAGRPVGSSLKCSNCGASLEEPEDRADGKLRCAYCHQWTTV